MAVKWREGSGGCDVERDLVAVELREGSSGCEVEGGISWLWKLREGSCACLS